MTLEERDYLKYFLKGKSLDSNLADEFYNACKSSSKILALDQLNNIVGTLSKEEAFSRSAHTYSSYEAFNKSLRRLNIRDADHNLLITERQFACGVHLDIKNLPPFTPLWIDNGDGTCYDERTGVIIDIKNLPLIKGAAITIKSKVFNPSYVTASWGTNKKYLLHRLIMQPNKNEVVDHINGNGLDNRESNLRKCPQYLNAINRRNTVPRQYKKTSEYKGVSISKSGSITTSISILGQRLSIRKVESELKAARLYDMLCIVLAGDYANTNFDKSSYSKKDLKNIENLYLKNFKKVTVGM